MNESIYDLIPPADPSDYQQRASFRSRPRAGVGANPIPTSYSTFPSKAQPKTAPLSASSSAAAATAAGSAPAAARDTTGASLFAGRAGVMGRVVGPEVDPKKFLKKHTGQPELPPVVPPLSHSRHAEEPRRPPVPKVADKPVMGLMTEKDFVHANAVDVICSAPRKVVRPDDLPRPTDRRDFGQVPSYLSTIKSEITREQQAVEAMHQSRSEAQAEAREQMVRQLPEAERVKLLTDLQEKWQEKHRVYQSLPFSRTKDINYIAKKEAMERELKEMEAALEKLNKKVVYVYNDSIPMYAQYARAQALADAQRAAMTM